MSPSDLAAHETPIPGLLLIDLVVHEDPRGWFKENWQRAKMTATLGLPDFGPVQHSVAFNSQAGVTRGFHAEPWDKLVSVAHGRIFGAWVDLRDGDSFGAVFTAELGPETAVFVPRGVANSYQTLTDETVYSYLVNDHWSPESRSEYSYLNLADETVNIAWPIPLADAIISDADAAHPRLDAAHPVPPKQTLIIGSGGQLGRALHALLPHAVGLDLPDFDVTNPDIVAAYPWKQVGVIINASAYTAVDAAETPEGRRACWASNVSGVAALCRVAAAHRIPLVQISTDYVFDGAIADGANLDPAAAEHTEDEPFSPLGVYGQTKAAGDALVAQVARHYIVRTTWLIGDGNNFVRTMATLAARGVSPAVVDDQFGRLTFADDLAAGICHLIDTQAPYGTYNLTNAGPVQSWCDIARDVFELCGRDRADVTATTTADYGAGKALAPRPTHSALNLDKISATGFVPVAASERLAAYVASLGQ